jgi:DNA-binding NarL/FixJ family response regulator
MSIRVLIVEDHPIVRESVWRALDSDPGIEIVGGTDNGMTALRLARELAPDVMVLDLRIHGIGGRTVLERVRREAPDVRALVLTANEHPDTLLDAVAAGAAGYLSKDATGKALREAVVAIHGGGSVVTPRLAAGLLREVAGTARGEPTAARPQLVARELDILRLLSRGLTDKEIAAELYVSPRTVQSSLTRIRSKVGVRRRSELARWAVEHAIG